MPKLSMTEIKILSYLSQGPCDVEDLADLLVTPAKNVPVYLYRLRKKGWVTSRRDGYQAPATYSITQAGLETFHRIHSYSLI